MPRGRPATDDADEEERSDEEEPVPRLPRSQSSRTTQRGVRAWDSEEEPGPKKPRSAKDEAAAEQEDWQNRPKRPIFFRARDSLFFEPLLALCVVVVLLASLYGYTGNWPPMYVVESNSMQHGSGDSIGLINAGDLVLAKQTAAADVTTYFEGMRSGFSTYGEYGDVLLYYPNDVTGGTPIIHRALLWLVYNPDGTFSVPDLVGFPCGSQPGAVYQVETSNGCLASPSTAITGALTLFSVGWAQINVTLQLTGALGDHSGFVTMGDNNTAPDQPTLSQLVEPHWMVGVARGMLPWFGSVKLLLTGEASYVPSQSWIFLGITLVTLVLVAFGIHYALRARGIEDARRRREEEEGREDESSSASAKPARRSVQPWDSEEEVDEEQTGKRRPKHARASRSRDEPRTDRSGRPAPKTQRDTDRGKARKRSSPADDE